MVYSEPLSHNEKQKTPKMVEVSISEHVIN